jgi:hypothetical protein
MLANKWNQKALKYKAKYLALKKQLGGVYDEKQDDKFLTSRLDPSTLYYFNQNLMNYWISSSHNTYLPYEQNTNINSVCYYRLQLMSYFGGCVEIDTYGVTDKKDDIIINHMITNSGTTKLSDILNIIVNILIIKIKRGFISGPLILNFDNSSPSNALLMKTQQELFWEVVNRVLLENTEYQKISRDTKYTNLLSNESCVNALEPTSFDALITPEQINKLCSGPILFIHKDFDLSKIPLRELSFKILFRWGQNNPENCSKDKVKNELCPPNKSIFDKISGNTDKWVHLNKSKMDWDKTIISLRNLSDSKSTPAISSYKEVNLFTILNTQRNILRWFPFALNTSSGNYDNMKYFRDGAQIVALNLQKVGNSRLLNDSVFIPTQSEFCKPTDVVKATEKNSYCHYGVDSNIPLSYRLKPLWLMGLVPYPQLYDLEIKVNMIRKITRGDNKLKEDKDYSNIEFLYGLNKKEYSENNGAGSVIRIPNVDVTVPFFVVTVSKKTLGIKSEAYKNGVEIVWEPSSRNGNKKEMVINVHKYHLESGRGIENAYNKVDAKVDDLEACQNVGLLNYEKTITMHIEYMWTLSNSKENTKHVERVTDYNDTIKRLRGTQYSGFSTEQLLNNLSKLIEYQDSLSNNINLDPKIVAKLAKEVVVDDDKDQQSN